MTIRKSFSKSLNCLGYKKPSFLNSLFMRDYVFGRQFRVGSWVRLPALPVWTPTSLATLGKILLDSCFSVKIYLIIVPTSQCRCEDSAKEYTESA